jgi:ABC-2 type transport system permease protein
MTAVELRKQLFRMRTYLSMLIMVGIPTLMTAAFLLTGGPRDRRDQDLFALATRSGLNMPLAALALMSNFLLPVVVVNFAAGSIAEEANWGSLRYLLLRPVSRSRVLASKLTIIALLAVIATFLIVIAGTIEGVVAFGWHPVLSFSGGKLESLAPGTALARLLLAALYVTWSMTGIVAFGFFLSTVTDAALGALMGGMGLFIVSFILDALPPLKGIAGILPTHYWHAWEALFTNPVSSDHLVRGLLLQVPYTALFLTLAWWWFHRKDIVS